MPLPALRDPRLFPPRRGRAGGSPDGGLAMIPGSSPGAIAPAPAPAPRRRRTGGRLRGICFVGRRPSAGESMGLGARPSIALTPGSWAACGEGAGNSPCKWRVRRRPVGAPGLVARRGEAGRRAHDPGNRALRRRALRAVEVPVRARGLGMVRALPATHRDRALFARLWPVRRGRVAAIRAERGSGAARYAVASTSRDTVN